MAVSVDQIYRRRFNDVEARKVLWRALVDKVFGKYINEDDVVLDVPCGYGEFINAITCKKKIGLDINPDSKKYLGKDVQFLKASSTKIPLTNNSVDKIFVSNFFEHITREDIQKTIIEFRRILKDGGQVMVLQPNVRFAYKNYWMFFDHITAVDDRALEEVFSIEQLRLVKRILRFTPYTSQSIFPVSNIMIRLYLSLPFVWRFFGQQTFMVFEK